MLRRADQSKRVARVQMRIAKEEIEGAMELRCARFGDDFNPSEAWAAVFGREWVGVDADFPYLILGRNPAAEKPVNNELHSTSGRRSRSSELRQVGG